MDPLSSGQLGAAAPGQNATAASEPPAAVGTAQAALLQMQTDRKGAAVDMSGRAVAVGQPLKEVGKTVVTEPSAAVDANAKEAAAAQVLIDFCKAFPRQSMWFGRMFEILEEKLSAIEMARKLRECLKEKAHRLTSLCLGRCSLRELPPEIGLFTGLEELFLSENGLTSLPQEIGQCANLKVLYLDKNKLVIIPCEIAALRSLKVLKLQYNLIDTLPSWLGSLKGLANLTLHHNQLSEIPDNIADLGKCEIDLRCNPNLKVLPPKVAALPNLAK